ncbi:MAG: hypothetical protein LBT74_01615 [Acidobacteriota bacterium]|nr:hypothetical protein [Acidobacteriota bacterium]
MDLNRAWVFLSLTAAVLFSASCSKPPNVADKTVAPEIHEKSEGATAGQNDQAQTATVEKEREAPDDATAASNPAAQPAAESEATIRKRLESGEMAAIVALQAYGTAQIDYSGVHEGWRFGTLADLVAEQYLDAKWLSSNGFGGYRFEEDPAGPPKTFMIAARPVTPNRTGRYSYTMTTDMVVRYASGPPGVKPGDYVRDTLPSPTMQSREMAAIQALQYVAQSMLIYAVSSGGRNFTTLARLVNDGYLDERHLSPDGFNGYRFEENTAGLPKSFEVIARPIKPNHTGRYSYSISNDHVVRYVNGPTGFKPGDYVRDTLPSATMESREMAAISALQSYVSAQHTHALVNRADYATLAQLVHEHHLNERYLSEDGFNGYRYTENAAGLPKAYELIARPVSPNKTGRYAYSVKEDGVIRYVSGPPGVKPGDYVRDTLPSASRQSREMAAISALRALGSAQTSYSIQNSNNFTTLGELVAEKFIDERYSGPDGFNGYRFTEDPTLPPNSFKFVAQPIKPNVSGRYVYSLGVDTVVRYVDGPPGTKAGDVVDR